MDRLTKEKPRVEEGRTSASTVGAVRGDSLGEVALPVEHRSIERLDAIPRNTVVDRAHVSAHGPALSAAEIIALRRGQGVTLNGELPTEHVARALNDQLQHYSVEEIGRVIDQFRGPRETIEQIFELVTQYGAIEQLTRLGEVVSERCAAAQGSALYAPEDTSLAAAVRYLGVNKSILPVDWKIRSTAQIESDTVVVLDDTVLDRLRADPAMVAKVLAGSATLLAPLGYLNGVTPFRTPHLDEVEARVGRIVAEAEIALTDPAAEVERKVVAVMREEVLGRLDRIDPRLRERVEFVAARSAPGESALERITYQLNGEAGIAAEALDGILARLDPRYRSPVKDLVVQHADVHSHISLGRAAREHGELIARLAASRGVDTDDVTFFCPEANKSFSMYGLIFREANPDFPPRSYTTGANLERWLKEREERPRLVVVLDDFAGTGDSLRRASSLLVEAAPTAKPDEVVLSPLIASAVAVRRLGDAVGAGGTLIAPVQIETPIIDGAPYRSASAEEQLRQRAALGLLGFRESGTMTALPYMSPDNNVQLFAACFAEFFTLYEGAVRERRGGVKPFAAKRFGAPLDVLCEEGAERFAEARIIAGHLPMLKHLLEQEGHLQVYWERLPPAARAVLDEEWAKTEAAYRAERPVAVYGQLRHCRDVLFDTRMAPRDKSRVAEEFRELQTLAAQHELSPELRRAIDEFGRDPAVCGLLAQFGG